jgi:hypothetical protein
MAPVTQTPAEPAAIQVLLALYSYTDSRMKEIGAFFNPLSVDQTIRFVKAGPAHRDNLWCDIACMLYDKSVDVDSYAQDIATLKLMRKIPVILALVFDTDRAAVEPHVGELACM